MDHHHQSHSRRESFSVSVSTSTTTTTTTEPEIGPLPLLSSSSSSFDNNNLLPEFPFGRIEGLDRDDLRETAYEIFFTACRSSPGFGGKNAMTYPPPAQDSIGDGGGGGGGGIGGYGLPKTNGLNLVATSKVKRALGLKTVARRTISSRKASPNSNPSSPKVMSPSSNLNSGSGSGFGGFGVGGGGSGGGGGGGGGLGFVTPLMRLKRPLTAAEIMKQQMRISEQSDNRLRKTLMRTLVGQMGRRVETIIIPLELLRHLKVGDFSSANDYHLMQKRQLKILEAGLLLHPSVPLDPTNISAMQLREIIRESEAKPIDTGRNSETVRMLCNSVVSLSLRSLSGATADVCHWADGFPMNIHLYISLLHSIFDIKEPTSVLDEVDELLELIKKTWSTLGINKVIHNVCFMWVLFQRYASTAQVEQDLLCASHVMLAEVANDTKKMDRDHRDVIYIKVLTSTLTSMVLWSEKKLLDYHESFHKGTAGLMDSLLPLVLLAARILDEDVPSLGVVPDRGDPLVAMGNKVDNYIRSSMKNAFAKNLNGTNCMSFEAEEASESLLQLAKDTENLATKERDYFSPILKKWHPVAAGVAASTLHSCYRSVLKQYLDQFTMLNNETVRVLQIAGKLEKELIQMVVETSVDCEEAGKVVIRAMEQYEVDSIILKRLKTWIEESLKKGRQCFERSKETETWNPKSKTEPYAQSAVNIMKLVHESIDDFFEIPVSISDDLVHDLADGLELLVLEYTSFVASCGSKQSYIPPLPPLTRCNQDSKLTKLWRKATPCRAGSEDMFRVGSTEGNHPRPSTSRGTQRLYIRLNTLQYILAYLHSVDKSLSLSRRQNPLPRNRVSNHGRHLSSSPCYFDLARSSILAACQNVAEIAAYRLVFLDSNSVFYESLYTFDVANSRIRPALRILKQNLTLLTAILMDQVQALAIKEVMKATFEAYLMVLLAGGGMRSFSITDHEMIEEDFESLKRAFCTRGEGMVAEEVVEREAETVEGVVGLMGQSTEQLVEDFSIVACEVSGLGRVGAGQKVPMPPTTGRWNRADPNTILRVLCYRNDSLANSFLKKTFQLAKRR